MPWIASKYWSVRRRIAIAEDSGRDPSLSATSVVIVASATARHAPALQQGHQQDARRGQVQDVLRAAVGRAAHLDDLECAEEVPSTFQVPRHDHAVRNGLLDAPAGVALLGGHDLGDEEARAPLRAELRAQPQEEVPDPLLVLDPIADGGDGVQHEPLDLLVLDRLRDRIRQEPRLVEVQVVLVDPELLVDLREVDELELPLLHEAVLEEVEGDDVQEELVRGLRDAQVQGILAVQRPSHEEFDADGRLPGPDGARDEDRVASRDASVQDVIDRIDAREASLALVVALLRGHRLGVRTRASLYEVRALSINPESRRGPRPEGGRVNLWSG